MSALHNRSFEFDLFGITKLTLWLALLLDGLKLDQVSAESVRLAQCHWAGQGKYLIVRFLTNEDRLRVLSHRKNLGNGYRPHGRPISLVDDRTREQSELFTKAQVTCKSLLAHHVAATNVNGLIKINGKLYPHTDPYILSLL